MGSTHLKGEFASCLPTVSVIKSVTENRAHLKLLKRILLYIKNLVLVLWFQLDIENVKNFQITCYLFSIDNIHLYSIIIIFFL